MSLYKYDSNGQQLWERELPMTSSQILISLNPENQLTLLSIATHHVNYPLKEGDSQT